jgi:hypothetical protein
MFYNSGRKNGLFLYLFTFLAFMSAASGCGGSGGGAIEAILTGGDTGAVETNRGLTEPSGAIDICQYFPVRPGDKFAYSNGDYIYESGYMGEIDACGVRAVKLGNAAIFDLYYIDETGLYLCGNQNAVYDKKIMLSSKSPAMNEQFVTNEISSGEVKIKAVCKFWGCENISTPPADFNNALKFEITYQVQTVETEISRTVIYLAKNAGPVHRQYFVSGHVSPLAETTIVSGEAGGLTYAARKKKWTAICYICGRTDDFISLAADYEMLSLKYSGIERDMNIVIQFVADPKYSQPGRLYLNNSKFEVARLFENQTINTGDENNLNDFCEWAVKMFPAEHYLLSISGHGSGVISMDDQSKKEYRAPNYSVGYDDHSMDSLNVLEFKRVCSGLKKEIGGKKIDIVLFDACLMNMVEIACQLKDEADYAVSSMRTVTGYGMDWALFSDKFKKLSDKSPLNVGKAMVDAYIDSETLGGGNTNVCVTDLSKTDEFTGMIDELAAVVIENLDGKNRNFFDLLKSSIDGSSTAMDENNFYRRYVDFFDFMVCLKECFGPNHQIGKLADEIFSFRDKIIVYNRSNGYYQYNRPVKGISIFIPDKSNWDKWKNQYKSIDFSINTKWPELIEKYLNYNAD